MKRDAVLLEGDERARKEQALDKADVAVHEMTHLLERGHGQRFAKLMDGLMPDWRARRDQLNDAPLAEEEWPA